MKNFLSLILTVVLLALGTVTTSHAQTSVQPLKARIGFLMSEGVGPPLLVARDEGLFKAQNIDIELIKFDNGTQMTQALVGGNLDGALAGAAVISSIAVRGLGVFIIPTTIETDSNLIYVTADSGINSIKDLKGKKIAFPFGTTAHVLVTHTLNKAGLKFSDIQAVNTGYQATTTALVSNAIPAAVITAGFVEAATNRGARRLTSLKDYYPDNAVLAGLVVSNDYFLKNKKDLPRIGAALIKSIELLKQEPIKKKNYDLYFSKMESYEAYKFAKDGVNIFPSADEWITLFKDGKVAHHALATATVLKDAGTIDRIGDPSVFLAPDIFLQSAQIAKTLK